MLEARRAAPALWALLAAGVLCLPYPLMALYRSVVASHFPALSAVWHNDGRFAVLGTTGMENDDEVSYAARVQSAARRGWPGDPFVKDNPSRRIKAMDAATYGALGLLQRLTGDINLTWVAARGLCAAAWFLLVYALMMRAAASPALALCCAAFVTYFSYLLTFLFLAAWPSDWSPLGPALGKAAWSLGSFGRTEGILRLPRPALTYAALFAAGLALVRAAERRDWKATGLSGVLGGLMLYVRLDVGSTYLFAAAAFAALTAPRDRAAGLHLAASAALSMLLSLPWCLAYFPLDPSLLERVNLTVGRTPDWSVLPLLALAAALWRRTPPGSAGLWFGCVLAGVAAACNVQLVLGHTTEPFHWKYFGNIHAFLGAAVLAHGALAPALRRLLPGAGRLAPWAAGAMTAGCLLQGVVYAGVHFPFQALTKDTEAALAWLEKEAPRDAVVAAAGQEANLLVPAYTGRYTLVSFPSPTLSDVPLDENARRFLWVLRALGTDAGRYLADVRRLTAGRAEGVDFRRTFDPVLHDLAYWSYAIAMWYPEAKTEALLRREEAAPGGTVPVPDFLWVGATERAVAGPSFKPEGAPGLTPAFRSPTVTLYRVEPRAAAAWIRNSRT